MGELGEFGVIDRVTRRLRAGSHTLVGPGDDAAVVLAPDGRVVVSTDLLVEGRHFRRDWSTAYDVGRKAAAQSLADVAGMGARATALVVGLAAPADLPIAWAEALADGLADEAAVAGAAVVGGDTVDSDRLTVAVTALGDLEGRPPVLRSGALPGEVVGVLGRLGWAEAGLRRLRAGESDGPLVDAHRRPQPPYAAGPALARAGVTAMLDVSDGLLADLGHVAAASGVRLDIELRPLRALGGAGITDQDLLTGGEDHALAFTVAAGTPLPDGALTIGRVGQGEGVWVDGARAEGSTGHEHWGPNR